MHRDSGYQNKRYQNRTYQNRKYKKSRNRRDREQQLMNRFILGAGIAILVLTGYLLWNIFIMISQISSLDDIGKSQVTQSEPEGNKEEEALNGIDQSVFSSEQDIIRNKLENFADKNDFSVSEYPEELIELIQKNEETEEFVLNYPLKKGTFSNESLTECLGSEKVPLLMQWDDRWGYFEYGNNVMGLTGCGPTSLSMVALYLLQDPQMTPLYVAEYSIQNGYCVPGSGTSWNLMTEGARGLGLRVSEVSLDEEQIRKKLLAGHPIIAIMGAGDFTDNGHFIVFSGWKNGKIVVNDSNSKENSEKLWEYEDMKGQIRGMWAYRK